MWSQCDNFEVPYLLECKISFFPEIWRLNM